MGHDTDGIRSLQADPEDPDADEAEFDPDAAEEVDAEEIAVADEPLATEA